MASVAYGICNIAGGKAPGSSATLAKNGPAFVRGFGPGLVSGASANDPTTVGTIAIVAAATGYSMGWLVALLLPMLAVVQAIAASVGAVSQMNLQQAIVRTFGRGPAVASVVGIVGVGLFTLAADVQAGAQALTLFCGLPFYYFVVPLVVGIGWMLATQSYLRIERILAAFTLIFLCYAGSAVLARPDWGEVLRDMVVPHFQLSPLFVTGAIALLGTTLTGYVYFWESIEVAERRPQPSQVRKISSDAVLGMLVAGSSFLFILIATGATLGRHHLALQTAADAAAALKPLAGRLDQIFFGAGLFASTAIAGPVIAATNGYVVAQTFGLPAGLRYRMHDAPAFYRIIFASLALAGVVAILPIPTIPFLYWASVAGGLATPITLVFTMLVAQNRTVMRGRPIGVPLACAGWAVTGIVTLSSIGFIVWALSAR